MSTSDSELLKEIRDYLKVLAKMTANQATKDLTQTQAVETLLALGLETGTICELTGLPSTTVAPIVSRKRKATANKK